MAEVRHLYVATAHIVTISLYYLPISSVPLQINLSLLFNEVLDFHFTWKKNDCLRLGKQPKE